MKQVTLKSISLINFRGHKDLTVNFNEQTVISGDNATGKSTIMDAYLWVLFGKDQFGRDNYEITPIIDGKRLERVDSEVAAVIEVDHRDISLKKVFRQKWVRPRGQAEEEFKGNEVLHFFNEVPKKESEYKALIDATFDEKVFKMVTNPAQFLSLKWEMQREFLFNIAGNISDGEVLDRIATLHNKDAVMNITNILNSGRALVEFKKELTAKKKKLKEELDDIQPRIDQTVKLTPEARDFSAVENEIATIDAKILDIDNQLSDRSKAIRAHFDAIQEKQKAINDLKTQQVNLINTLKNEAIQEAAEANEEFTKKNGELNNLKMQLSNAQRLHKDIVDSIERLENAIQSNTIETDTLRKQWFALNESEYEEKAGCLMCPVFKTECGDQQAIGKHLEAQELAKQAFYNKKQADLDALTAKGKGLNEKASTLTIQHQDKNVELDTNVKLVGELTEKVKEIEAFIASYQKVEPLEIVPTNIAQWVALKSEIDHIEAEISTMEANAGQPDNSDLVDKKAALNVQRDELKKQLNDKFKIDEYKLVVANLQEQGRQLSQQIADLEKQGFVIDDFNRVKIEECDRRVNSLFQIVKFKLFDKTIEGNEFETCVAVNKSGVPIASTNTAEKINAGLDIIRTLSNFYNVSAPIFVDGAESVNEFINTGSQMIFLRVTKDKALVY